MRFTAHPYTCLLMLQQFFSSAVTAFLGQGHADQ